MTTQPSYTVKLTDPRWAESYRRLAVRPLSPRTLYASDDRWSDTVRAEAEGAVLLGGIAAAAVLDDQVRATDGIVYAATLGPVVTLLRLTADPTPFRVEVRERFWGDDLPASQPGLVPSVLIYGDLLRDSDSRSLEIAANLRRNDARLRVLGDAAPLGPGHDVDPGRRSVAGRSDGPLASRHA
jgi:hypothetical protein